MSTCVMSKTEDCIPGRDFEVDLTVVLEPQVVRQGPGLLARQGGRHHQQPQEVRAIEQPRLGLHYRQLPLQGGQEFPAS